MIRVTYGLNVMKDDEELVSLFGETLERIMETGSPGASTIDFFPFREFIPGCVSLLVTITLQ